MACFSEKALCKESAAPRGGKELESFFPRRLRGKTFFAKRVPGRNRKRTAGAQSEALSQKMRRIF